MTRAVIIYIFISFGLKVSSQTLKGIVQDYETGEKIEFANMILQNISGQKFTTTSNGNGNFVFNGISCGTYSLTVISVGYQSIEIDSIEIPAKHKILVGLKQSEGGFICTDPVVYICQENNPSYDYYVNNKKTTNYTDSAGLKQGLWVKYYDRIKDSLSKFYQNQTMEMGYYKDGKKIGRWLYIKPDGKVKRVVTYEMDKVIRKDKCTPKNYPQKK